LKLGFTGPPGGGKSSLINKLVPRYRTRGHRIGVIAVDPTSPFTGGAILGDRIRMVDHQLDPNVFIRSMGTRGSLGGLAQRSRDVAKILEYAGFDLILFETVGSGQVGSDISKSSDAIAVVMVPEGGDYVQTMKAGIMEMADIYVVNKSDRDGADYMIRGIMGMVELSDFQSGWRPPIVATQATSDKGLEELMLRFDEFIAFQKENGLFEKRRREQLIMEVGDILQDMLRRQVRNAYESGAIDDAILEKILHNESDPYTAALELMEHKTTLPRQ
jgi:LAO/AO transport system kinase